jgi:hypothetical protein
MTSALYGWYAQTFSDAIASIRLRCFTPMAALRDLGLDVERFDPSHANRYGAVVFSKIYDEKAIAAARALKAAGARVILDLCDNHFYGDDAFTRERTGRLGRMIEAADLVVSSTAVLTDQLRERFPGIADRLTLIPDYLEEASASQPTFLDRLALGRLDRFFARTPGSLRLIWFGNHGAGPAPAGMADLALIRTAVEAQAAATPLTLTVMSNSLAKYLRLVRPWAIPTIYLGWTAGRADAVLRRHHVAVLPINRNPFTVAKTINRPATALRAGLGVIADAIPSYEELRPYIPLDDWAGGLRRYAETRPSADPGIAAARAHLQHAYRPEAITALWRSALER